MTRDKDTAALPACDGDLILPDMLAWSISESAAVDAVIEPLRQRQLAGAAVTAGQPFPLRKLAIEPISIYPTVFHTLLPEVR